MVIPASIIIDKYTTSDFKKVATNNRKVSFVNLCQIWIELRKNYNEGFKIGAIALE